MSSARCMAGPRALAGSALACRAGSYLADDVGRDLSIPRCRIELGVAEQHLDDANVDVLFEKMGRKAMAKRVWRHPAWQTSKFRSHVTEAVQLACVIGPILSRPGNM